MSGVPPRLASKLRNPTVAGAIAFVLLFAVCAWRYHAQGFFSSGTVVNLLVDNAFLGIAAVGMTFVIISGGIDLAVGAVMSAASIFCAVLLTERGLSPTWAIPLTLAAGAFYGAVAGALIHLTRLPAFIVTLSGMLLVRGLGYLVHLESVPIDNATHGAIASFRLTIFPEVSLPTTALLLLGCVVAGQFVLSTTRLGLRIRAIGGSEDAARLQGVPMLATRVQVYAISGLCAALAGVTLTFYLSSGSHIEGVGLELDAIAAAVIGGAALTGGAGSMIGTLLGVLTVGLVLTAITSYEGTLNSGLTRVAIGVLLLAFVILQRLLGSLDARNPEARAGHR